MDGSTFLAEDKGVDAAWCANFFPVNGRASIFGTSRRGVDGREETAVKVEAAVVLEVAEEVQREGVLFKAGGRREEYIGERESSLDVNGEEEDRLAE